MSRRVPKKFVIELSICPQHDILWPQLTAREHLEVYSLFKGNIDKPGRLDEILQGVKLYDVQNKQCGKFSGGMKRRLSVAIAAMGNPDVIFLDEPTTGMDPMNKKFVWDMITFKEDALYSPLTVWKKLMHLVIELV